MEFFAIYNLNNSSLPSLHDIIESLALCLKAKTEKARALEVMRRHALLGFASELDDYSQVCSDKRISHYFAFKLLFCQSINLTGRQHNVEHRPRQSIAKSPNHRQQVPLVVVDYLFRVASITNIETEVVRPD